MGSGRIDGRPVMVAAEDFTVKAGTISQSANSKRYRVAELAVADRVPLIMMLEGAGFRIPSQRKLEQWVFDSVVESVFGYDVEPDGWDSEGSPSWLLVLGLV